MYIYGVRCILCWKGVWLCCRWPSLSRKKMTVSYCLTTWSLSSLALPSIPTTRPMGSGFSGPHDLSTCVLALPDEPLISLWSSHGE